jgi:NAD-dependent deacetylase
MKKLIVFTGAGMSAESGIPTFRGSDGLWENHRIEDVATPEAWKKDPELVLEFYNQRRRRIIEVQPNEGHYQIAKWQNDFDVTVVTQNIDDLHERAGSKQVLHLHGEIRKARSTFNPQLVYEIEDWSLNIGDKCERGSQLRPHIVWFGEEVPMLQVAAEIIEKSDLFVVVGTSLQVYPAAGLIHHAHGASHKFFVDPAAHDLISKSGWTVVSKGAAEGLQEIDRVMLR